VPLLRQAVLDALVDADEPLTVARILAEMPAGTTRSSAESAIKREYAAGRILRVGPGVYKLAPPKPPESPEAAKPAAPPEPPRSDEQWLEALEAWAIDPPSWDRDRLGPPMNEPGNLVPPDVKLRFNDRLRKREQRAAAKQAAAAAEADRELADRLLAVTGGNFMDGAAGLSDLAPIKQMIRDGVPIESIKIGLKRVTDRRIDTRAAPIGSWRDERFLRAVARCALLEGLLPRLVESWSTAKTTSPKLAHASEPSPATPEPPASENSPAAPPAEPAAPSVDEPALAASLLRELGPAMAAQAPTGEEAQPGDGGIVAETVFPKTGENHAGRPVAAGRDQVLAAFNRNRTSAQPATPPPCGPGRGRRA